MRSHSQIPDGNGRKDPGEKQESNDCEKNDKDKDEDEDKESTKGRVVGGSFLDGFDEEDSSDKGPLKKVDCDMPSTLTERQDHNGKEIILLHFAEGDKENPFNWSTWRKRYISWLLCAMTLFIGLATTAYNSGINSMVADLDTSVEIGELGLFLFK